MFKRAGYAFLVPVFAAAFSISLTASERDLPDLPTSIEAGYPDSDTTVWYGVFVPSKTPRDIVQKAYNVATQVLQTPVMKQKLAQLAVDPMPMTPEQFDAYVASEIAQNGKLFKATAIK
jgi:tripartite-type tricarboxylate transporter receptor subunit TctC